MCTVCSPCVCLAHPRCTHPCCAQPGLLAKKFDRLSDKYDQWTAGNRCTYYDWLARTARAAGETLSRRDARVLDVACGIGLPGHMLRLAGFKGHMAATDISPGMLSQVPPVTYRHKPLHTIRHQGCSRRSRPLPCPSQPSQSPLEHPTRDETLSALHPIRAPPNPVQARARRVYDELFVANANDGLPATPSSSLDLVVCVGAMELLSHRPVLAEFARILRPEGRLWASFQWEKAAGETGEIGEAGEVLPHPTAHQNVRGVTEQQLRAELEEAGFDVGAVTIERSPCAFYTPSPKQDGSLLPVPYLYVSVGRRVHDRALS